MLIGILSDSHDRYDAMGRAVALLQARGATHLLHCGDLCQPRMLDHLAGCRAAFVWGNCDWDRQELARHGDALGVRCMGNFGELELHGRRIALVHGDDARRLQQAIDSGQFDYVLHGHTHLRRDERFGRTRVINPGALHRAAVKTAAALDLETDRLEYISIDPGD